MAGPPDFGFGLGRDTFDPYAQPPQQVGGLLMPHQQTGSHPQAMPGQHQPMQHQSMHPFMPDQQNSGHQAMAHQSMHMQNHQLMTMGGIPHTNAPAPAAAAPAKKRKIAPKSEGGVPASSEQLIPVDYGNGKVVPTDPNTRVSVKHRVTGKKLAGTAAPMAKQVQEWLISHPDYDLCSDPPGRSRPKAKAPSRASKPATPRAKRPAAPKLSTKIAWPLSDQLESGPAGMYVAELRILHKEANVLFNAGHYEEANNMFQEALEMAKKTVDEFTEVEKKLDALPPIYLKNPPVAKSGSTRQPK